MTSHTLEPVRSRSLWSDPPPNEPINAEIHRQRMSLVRKEGKKTKLPGKRRGHEGNLSWIGEAVYGYLSRLLLHHGGAVFPAVAAIAAEVGCSEKAVHQAKRELRSGGWVEWAHRCEKAPTAGQAGPQLRQISNWYRLLVPAWAQKQIDQWNARKKAAAYAYDDGWAERDAFRDRCEVQCEEIEARDLAARRAAARDRSATWVYAVPKREWRGT